MVKSKSFRGKRSKPSNGGGSLSVETTSSSSNSTQQQQWSASKRTWTLMIVVATCVNLIIQIVVGGGGSQSLCAAILAAGGGGGLSSQMNDENAPPLVQVSQPIQQVSQPPQEDADQGGGLRTTSAVSGSLKASADPVVEDPCEVEYERVTAKRIEGLTYEDINRANTYHGNRYRLAKLGETLMDFQQHPRAINAVVSGGSISLGHGVVSELMYSERLQSWLDEYYPLPTTQQQKHKVLNKGAHGADICAMAKRLNILIQDLPDNIDLFVLEFAVNDYQGQDHIKVVDFRMDVFFDGFQQIALCTESVLHKLLLQYPKATVLFLETRTAILQRKTASLLHMGAAQHYQVPVISYDQALFPDYQYLLQILRPYNYSTTPGDTILPYPHGCHPCVREHISPSFRNKGCADVCHIQRMFTGEQISCVPSDHNNQQPPPPPGTPGAGRVPCYVPFIAHDEVHPSGVGHQVITDLIVEKIAATTRDVCREQQKQRKTSTTSSNNNHYPNSLERMAVMPTTGWMVSQPNVLAAQSAFLWVNDTYEIFVEKRPLTPSSSTPGFTFYQDTFGRHGWIATNEAGGESITFGIQLPQGECYIPYLAVLKSYENMGTMKVTVVDKITNQQTSVDIDGLWKPRISVPSDTQLLPDPANASPGGAPTNTGCTGNCQVTVTSNPTIPGRTGNKVKVITLSVRRCIQ